MALTVRLTFMNGKVPVHHARVQSIIEGINPSNLIWEHLMSMVFLFKALADWTIWIALDKRCNTWVWRLSTFYTCSIYNVPKETSHMYCTIPLLNCKICGYGEKEGGGGRGRGITFAVIIIIIELFFLQWVNTVAVFTTVKLPTAVPTFYHCCLSVLNRPLLFKLSYTIMLQLYSWLIYIIKCMYVIIWCPDVFIDRIILSVIHFCLNCTFILTCYASIAIILTIPQLLYIYIYI